MPYAVRTHRLHYHVIFTLYMKHHAWTLEQLRAHLRPTNSKQTSKDDRCRPHFRLDHGYFDFVLRIVRPVAD